MQPLNLNILNLSEELWDEWGSRPVRGTASADAECAGLLAGLFPKKDSPLTLRTSGTLRTSRLWVARRLLKLWRRTSWFARLNWNAADALSISHSPGSSCSHSLPEGRGRVSLSLPPSLYDEIKNFGGALKEAMGKNKKNIQGRLSAGHRAWLRGLWGSCGSLYLPRTGYYLVLRVASPVIADQLSSLLPATGLPWIARTFRGAHETLLRDQESIVTFLCNAGLPGTSLRLEDRAIMRSVRGQANRVRNCDTANIKRSVRASEAQTRLVLKLAGEGRLSLLPASLRELAEARLANPGASLSELGEKLSPPIGKSTVKYRWVRLSDYALKNKTR